MHSTNACFCLPRGSTIGDLCRPAPTQDLRWHCARGFLCYPVKTSILSLRIEKLADRAKAQRAGQGPRNLTVPHPLPTEPGTLSGKLFLISIAVFVVTVVVTVFPVAVVMVMSFAPIPLTVSPYVTVVLIPFAVVSAGFAPIPLPIVPYITMVLIPFAVMPARYGNDDLLP